MYEQTDFFLTSISVLSMESCPNVSFTTRLMMQLYQYLYIVMGLNGSATNVSLLSRDGFSQFYRASTIYTHGSRFVVFCCVLVLVSFTPMPWWRHQMETFSALLALCAGNSPVTDEFPTQRPVKRSFYVFFDLRLNKRLSKQSWGWWFETPSRSPWRHCNATGLFHRHERMPQSQSLR